MSVRGGGLISQKEKLITDSEKSTTLKRIDKVMKQ